MPRVFKFTAGSSEWLDRRSKNITATEIAALFGLDRNKSIAKVLRNKIAPEKMVDNVWMQRGRILEPGVLIAMHEAGFPVAPAANFMEVCYIEHDTLQLAASMDGKMNSKQGFYIVECKTIEWNKLVEWRNNPPLSYLLQVQGQMLVTGTKKSLLSVLATVPVEFRGHPATEFHLIVWEVPFHEKIASYVASEVDRFWYEYDIGKVFIINKDIKEDVKRLAFENLNKVYEDIREVRL